MHINETEFIIFEVFPNNQPSDHILMATVYCHPSGFYPTDFFMCLQEISHAYKHIIITGDFDADLISPDSHTIPIQKLINESALFQLDLGITHTPSNPMFSPSIDTFIVDSASKVFDKFTSSSPLTGGYHALYLSYSTSTPKPIRIFKLRSFKKFNHSDANALLSHQFNPLTPDRLYFNWNDWKFSVKGQSWPTTI